MNIAYTSTAGNGDLDLLLSDFADVLIRDGFRLAGVVQVNTDREDCHACDMDVKVLPYGPVYRISQQLGKHARGCRLDATVLEKAVLDVMNSLSGNVDVLILNKFGKHEANGKGFRDVIAEALSQDLPVITGVNTLNRDAFIDFSGGLAEFVPPEIDALRTWLKQAQHPNLETV